MSFMKFLAGITLMVVFILVLLFTISLAIYLINLPVTFANLLVFPLVIVYLVFIYFSIKLLDKITA